MNTVSSLGIKYILYFVAYYYILEILAGVEALAKLLKTSSGKY